MQTSRKTYKNLKRLKARIKMNFKEKLIKDDITVDCIDDFVSQWHESDSTLLLHEYLGLTDYEYSIYVELGEKELLNLLCRKYKKVIRITVEIPAQFIQEENTFVVINEELNLSGYGNTIQEAEEMFRTVYETHTLELLKAIP